MGSDPQEPESEVPRAPGMPASPGVPRWAAVALPDPEPPAPAGLPGAPGDEPHAAVTAEEAVSASGHAASLSSARSVATGTRRRTVSSMGTLWTFSIIGLIAFAGAASTRLLSDWELGRWWALEAALVAVAGLCGLIGVIVAVSALGEIARHRSVTKGTVGVALGLLVSGLVLVSALILGRNDWIELDVPAAWDRLDLGSSAEPSRVETRSGGSVTYEELRLDSDWGSCYPGPPEEVGKVVACTEPHRTEVIGSFELPRRAAGETYPGEEELAAVALPRCQQQIDNKAAGAEHDGTALAIVPPPELWEAGDSRVVCVVTFETEQTAPLGPAG